MALPLAAQSNQLLDQLLDQPAAGFADVVYMTLSAAKLLPDTATPEQALEALQQQNWKVPMRAAEAPIPLGDYAFLLMKAFKFSGGLSEPCPGADLQHARSRVEDEFSRGSRGR
jgi:hypothetical protein